jgi:hypothetical protein
MRYARYSEIGGNLSAGGDAPTWAPRSVPAAAALVVLWPLRMYEYYSRGRRSR